MSVNTKVIKNTKKGKTKKKKLDQTDSLVMKDVVLKVTEGAPIRRVARDEGLCHVTLKRYVDKHRKSKNDKAISFY